MKLPSIKRILTSDYDPKYNDIISKLANTLNYNLETYNTVLTQRVSLTDNTLTDLKTITVTVDSTGTPTTKSVFTVANTYITSIQGIQVIKAVNTSNNQAYVTSCPFISYTVQQNQSQNTNTITVTMNNITGLIANNTYDLTIIIYG